MKKLFKIGILALVIAQLSISCGGNNGDKNKDKSDSTKTDVKKEAKVDPTSGCD